jgi:hypothetical protein
VVTVRESVLLRERQLLATPAMRPYKTPIFLNGTAKRIAVTFIRRKKEVQEPQKQKKNKQDNYVQLKQLGDNCKETEKQKTANKKIEYN